MKKDPVSIKMCREIIALYKKILFPNIYGEEIVSLDVPQRDFKEKMAFLLFQEASKAYQMIDQAYSKNTLKEKIKRLMAKLPRLLRILEEDIVAIEAGDPASNGRIEIILAYPGFYAVLVYRLTHELYLENIPILPRIMAEHAHSVTGIDIHPGADIGKSFFIDHGTGVVIGETAEIGNFVKIYQGVTLGAIGLRDGKKLKGKKRHPTIKNNVTIYSGASILGGDTIIGNYVTIASNSIITASIEDHKLARNKTPELLVKDNNPQNKT
ncbi:MAG: serine acetyltransferase [Erysipelotrichaceae bacterium]|jgi:serine O-acetyltransferase|nr:serine acetyltransferase [Erysipelotrichaceae bacterium]